ncbi:MAG: type III pantothenate kinase [bacterium]|nr:type III pantothenate kinase [bacterium]
MLLAIDVGNTTTGAAVFDGDTIVSRNKLMTPAEITVVFLKSLIKKVYRKKITDVVVSSVVPFVDDSIKECVEEFFRKPPYFIDHTIDTGLTLKIDNPAELGADRIVDSVGALHFHNPPLIVIDSGTAITFDIIDKDYNYMGGAIFPGIELSINSLAQKAAKLNRIHFGIPDSIMGSNTESCIQAGIYYSYVGGISYMIDEYKKIIGQNAKTIATGGLSEFFKDVIKGVDYFEPDLIYYGLKKMHQRIKTDLPQS